MALTITTTEPKMARNLTADRRLFLTGDRKTVVDETDPTATFLLCGMGGEIAAEDVERLGLTVEDGKVVQAGAEPAKKEPAKKEPAKPKDKD